MPSEYTCRRDSGFVGRGSDFDIQSSTSTINKQVDNTKEACRYHRTAQTRITMPVEQTSVEVRRKAAREVIDILHEIATLLVSPEISCA